MRTFLLITTLLLFSLNILQATEKTSIREFDVKPENSPEQNKANLQKAIDWASESGAALFAEPSEEPYPVAGGIVLKKKCVVNWRARTHTAWYGA